MKEKQEKLVRVVSKCPKCGSMDEFQVPASGMKKRTKGVLLRAAFPDLPEHRIAQLATHLCEKCQGAPWRH